jgi:large subunit ribosomal protein L22
MAGEDIRAHARNVGISAQKVRLVIDLVRGKQVEEALNLLKFVPNKAAQPVSKAAGLGDGEW